MSEKIKALLATGRISNLPTVWCNCMAAGLILFHQSERGIAHIINQPWSLPLSQLTLLVLFISSLFYVGGCFLGDYYDKEFDHNNKPQRPIPSGILSSNLVFSLGFLQTFIAFVSAFLIPSLIFTEFDLPRLSLPVILLSLSIILYSRYHKKSLFIGLPLIGLCRFSLIIFAAATASILLQTPDFIGNSSYFKEKSYLISPIILYASAVCLYTICFASVARTESSDSPITWRNILRYTMLGLPFVALISKGEFYGNYLSIAAIVALAVYALWLMRAFQLLEKNKGIYVSKCLAGFCLLDACFVAQFGWIWFAICIVLFGFSLLLQNIAPAT